MNSTCPGRMSANSSGCGSLTLHTSSASAQMSSAVGTMVAPARTNSASVIEDSSPAPAWIRIGTPRWDSSRTPSGVIATRCSLSLTSVGTPTANGAMVPS